MRYPSLNVRAMRWNGSLYVLVVNSAERGVKARLFGLPEGATEAVALFEPASEDEPDAPRVLPVAGGSLDQAASFLAGCRFVAGEIAFWKNKLGIING